MLMKHLREPENAKVDLKTTKYDLKLGCKTMRWAGFGSQNYAQMT